MLCFGNGNLLQIITPKFLAKYERGGLECEFFSKPPPTSKMFDLPNSENHFGSQLYGGISDAASDVKQGFRIVMWLFHLNFRMFWFELFSFMTPSFI